LQSIPIDETTPPEVLAKEALRIAKNADYLSSHLSFTKRLCDIAERLRFLPIEDRPGRLQEELAKLNASGTMGGDPLNKVKKDEQDHVRVVRIPITESHVFRSKERTPVLLLVETLDEGAEERASNRPEAVGANNKVLISNVSTESEETNEEEKTVESEVATEEEKKEVANESIEAASESSPVGDTPDNDAEDSCIEQSPQPTTPVTPLDAKKVHTVETIDEKTELSDLSISRSSDHLRMSSIQSFQSEASASMAGSQDGFHGDESAARRK
jgi:hypothetical protein